MDPGYAAQYEDFFRWHWFFRGRRRILERVLTRALNGTPTRTVISIGCGPPSALEWLAPLAPNGLVVGLDADPDIVRGYDKQPRTMPDGCGFVIGRMEHPPLEPASGDVVLALDVLEHLEDDAAALAQTASLVKPGGLLVVTVPALPSLWGNQDVINHHYRRYTRATLADAFTRAGLPPPNLSFFNSFLFPPIAAVRWGRRLLRRPEENKSDFDGAHPGLMNRVLEEIFAAERHLIDRLPLPVGVSLLALHRANH